MIDLKEGDSFMNGLLLLGLSALILVVAYLFYGRYLVKTWGIDPKATTPAVAKEDGTDFVPTNKWSVFAHQFSSIAGAGPVTGPVMAMMFGWLPAFLWVIVGGVFFGAVQDFGALYTHLLNLMVNQWDKSLKNILDVKVKNYFSYFVGFSH